MDLAKSRCSGTVFKPISYFPSVQSYFPTLLAVATIHEYHSRKQKQTAAGQEMHSAPAVNWQAMANTKAHPKADTSRLPRRPSADIYMVCIWSASPVRTLFASCLRHFSRRLSCTKCNTFDCTHVQVLWPKWLLDLELQGRRKMRSCKAIQTRPPFHPLLCRIPSIRLPDSWSPFPAQSRK